MRRCGRRRVGVADVGLRGVEQRREAADFLLGGEQVARLRIAVKFDLAAGLFPLSAGFVEGDDVVVELGAIAAELLAEAADFFLQRGAVFAELLLAAIEIGLQEGSLAFDFGPVEFALVGQGGVFDFKLLGNAAALRAGFLAEPFEFLQLALEARLLFLVSGATARELANLGLMVVLRGVQSALGLLDIDFFGMEFRRSPLQRGDFLAVGDGQFSILGGDLLAGDLQFGLREAISTRSLASCSWARVISSACSRRRAAS